MRAERKSTTYIFLGIGIAGIIHELVISNSADIIPVILFGILVLRGIYLFKGNQ